MRLHSTTLAIPFACLLIASTAPVLAVQEPAYYSIQLVAPASAGIDMNDAGDVIGTSYPDTGCGYTCLPPLETVVWRNGVRTVLPTLAGYTGISLSGINASGWISGYAGYSYSNSHAVVWKLVGGVYQTVDLGVIPGTTISTAAGIDDLNRAVGNSTTIYFPPTTAPFVWSETIGLTNLTSMGAPNEAPLAISNGGTVATPAYWYTLDNPNVVHALSTQPTGYYPPGNYAAAINDSGDQARFLPATTSSALPYLFRYHSDGTWQQIWFSPAGSLAPYGVGSITNAGDITATVGGVGLIAYGPDGLGKSLTGKLSPAYVGGEITVGGPINNNGQILAQALIGRSQRLVRLTPAESCLASCIRVTALTMQGKFINDPANPGSCTPAASNRVTVSITVKDELGVALRGVKITGRIMDDYWTNKTVSATTNRTGVAKISYTGQACVGAVAFLLEDATVSGRALDRTTGVLSNYVIPL